LLLSGLTVWLQAKKAFTLEPGKNPLSGTLGNNTTESSNMSGDTHSHIGIGLLMPKNPTTSSLQGYNVYRSDDEQVTFNMINTAIVTDTTYVDMDVTYANHYYYVSSVYTECNSDASNIVLATPVVGIDPHVNGTFSVYPNPATEVINVTASSDITSIEVLNYLGQTVYNKQNVDSKTARVNVASMLNGVYFVKVTTTEGIRTVKVTVAH